MSNLFACGAESILVVLERSVTGLKVAKLANDGFLEKHVSQGARMTVVGYGEAQPNLEGVPLPLEQWDGLRRYGTSTMRDVYNAEWVRFNRDPSGTCFGDSGGPTFFLNRIVAVTSDGVPTCDTVDNRSRVDAQAVLDWIDSLTASLESSGAVGRRLRSDRRPQSFALETVWGTF
jgi:hypothetical protein